MTPMEITLLIIGVVIFCLSFVLKDKNEQTVQGIDEDRLREEVRRITDKEYDYTTGVNYMDIIIELEKMADYIINVDEAMFEHKHDK